MGLGKKLKRKWRDFRYAYNRFHTHFMHIFTLSSKVFGGLAFLAAILCIVSSILLIGINHSSANAIFLRGLIRASQTVFIVKVLYNLIFNFRQTKHDTRLFKWVADIAILLTLPALVYPHPVDPWFPWLEKILYNNALIFSIVGIYAIVEFSYGIMRMVNRRVNPTLMLGISFLFFIIIGSFLLMLPKCTYHGISYIDSLFVSTSAVSITGLTTVDVASTFTPFGTLVLAILIQIGGLGVMTFTSFFALFFSGNTSVYSQLVVKDMIYTKTINSLLPTLLYILGFTLVIEAIGAVVIFCNIHGTLGMSLEDELIFSGFHAMSAFCNAGFSNLQGGLSNPALLHSAGWFYLTISSLVFLGGIGFPILVNIKTALFRYLSRFWKWITRSGRSHGQAIHIYDMNTKIVLVTTLTIFFISAVLFFIFEYNNSLAGMSLSDKIVQSVFNAFVPRSSGFASVSPTGFLNLTIIMMLVLMWIGGASQSTAGGIKVNAFAVILLELKSVLHSRSKVEVFNRTIAPDSVRRANAIVVLSILGYIVYSMVLVALEPHLPVKSLLFEAASALFTVGSSLGITPQLGTPAKILLCTAMFFGRVGILSLLIGFVRRQGDSPVGRPVDSVIIN